MIKFAHVLLIMFSAVSLSATAEIIDNGTFTADTATHLDWLDLSGTGWRWPAQPENTYSEELTLNPGWRYATYDEVVGLTQTLFPGFDLEVGYANTAGDTGYVNQNNEVSAFWDLFGYDWASSDIHHVTGVFRRNDGTYTSLVTRFNYDNCCDYTSIQFDLALSDQSGNAKVHAFLVRSSEVPIPVAGHLFLTALAALLGLRKYKYITKV